MCLKIPQGFLTALYRLFNYPRAPSVPLELVYRAKSIW